MLSAHSVSRLTCFVTPACARLNYAETHAHDNVDGYILGVVTLDEAPAAAARVVIGHVDSGVSLATATSAAGACRFSQLTPGVYDVTGRALLRDPLQ